MHTDRCGNTRRQKCCAKGSGKGVKIQQFVYRDAMNVEPEMHHHHHHHHHHHYYYYYYYNNTIWMPPVTGISSWYFSRTSSDPHRSRFKLHTAALSALCVMFRVQLSFVANLSNVFPVQFPNFSLSFSLLFQWLQLLLVQLYISGSTYAISLYINSCILTSFPLPFAQHFCLQVLPHLSVYMFFSF